MKVCVINSLSPRYYTSSTRSCKKIPVSNLPQPQQPSFKGDIGQSIGSSAGIAVGLVATCFVGPLVAVGITAAALVAGAVVGNTIEDKMKEK